MKRLRHLLLALLCAGPLLSAAPAHAEDLIADPVVVATFDTGTNPFHPCFRREGRTNPRQLIPGYPSSSVGLNLSFKETYEQSLNASRSAVDSIQDRTLYHLTHTNLSFYGGAGARRQLVDTYPHGAQASSQIACEEFGLGANSQLVVMNWYADPVAARDLIRWAADRKWIDVIHLNVQDIPILIHDSPEVSYAVDKGKLVVVAAGNGVLGQGVSYPSEVSRYLPPGVLVAGASDQEGWTLFSNLNPHVVMDGCGTTAAHPSSFGQTDFGGTSSSSPRVTGYAAQVLGRSRAAFGHTGEGLLTLPPGVEPPASGPLTDGVLTAAELHEAIRRTAREPHPSRWDGYQCSTWWVPGPDAYAKNGYGKLSEHTLEDTIAYLSGDLSVPLRPEDVFYAGSEAVRTTYRTPLPPG